MSLTPKQAHYLFPVMMIGMMTFLLTGITGFIHNEFVLHLDRWMRNWGLAYAIALPTMLLLSPPLRRWIAKRTKS